MPNIRDIRINELGIRDIDIPDQLTSDPPLALPIYPPPVPWRWVFLLSISLDVLRHTKTIRKM